jgi:DNA-binding NarL/FixJ family response regulator
MTTRILLIGQGIFLDGLKHILVETSSLEIIDAVENWEQVHENLNQQQPDVIIVDHANADLRVSDLSPLLISNFPKIKVIYLTLSDNKMVVHDRRQVAGATVDDLLQALQSPEDGTETNP